MKKIKFNPNKARDKFDYLTAKLGWGYMLLNKKEGKIAKEISDNWDNLKPGLKFKKEKK